jgi:hypothetical protein
MDFTIRIRRRCSKRAISRHWITSFTWQNSGVRFAWQGHVNQNQTKLKFMRRTIRVVLCYAFAFQAFFAAYSIALASSPAANAGFIICHNASGDAPEDSDKRAPANIPCALCALAAQASGLLAPPAVTITAPATTAATVGHADIAQTHRPPPARAGLARAPPRFV